MTAGESEAMTHDPDRIFIACTLGWVTWVFDILGRTPSHLDVEAVGFEISSLVFFNLENHIASTIPLRFFFLSPMFFSKATFSHLFLYFLRHPNTPQPKNPMLERTPSTLYRTLAILIIISVSSSYLYPSSAVIVSSVPISSDGEGDTVLGVVGMKCIVEDALGGGDGIVVLNRGAVVGVVVVVVLVVVVAVVVGSAVMERNLC